MAEWVELSGKVLADTYWVGDILGKGGLKTVALDGIGIRPF